MQQGAGGEILPLLSMRLTHKAPLPPAWLPEDRMTPYRLSLYASFSGVATGAIKV
jgi:hypothetical protein